MPKSKCDIKCGWEDCLNPECRYHGKAAKRWHELRELSRERDLTTAEVIERNLLYDKMTIGFWRPRRNA